MENTQFHRVDMKRPTPETSLFYHTNCLCWSIVPLRVPLQNIYLPTFSALPKLGQADHCQLSSFWSLQHPYCMSRSPQVHEPHMSVFPPHAQLLTDSFSSWLSSTLLVTTFRELLFPVVAPVSSSSGLGHILLPSISVFHYWQQSNAHTLNYSSTINHGPKGTNENFKWSIVWFL